ALADRVGRQWQGVIAIPPGHGAQGLPRLGSDASLPTIMPPESPAERYGRHLGLLTGQRGSDAILGVPRGNCARACQGLTCPGQPLRLTLRLAQVATEQYRGEPGAVMQ